MKINTIKVLLDILVELQKKFSIYYNNINSIAQDYKKAINKILNYIQSVLDELSNYINKLEYKADELKYKMERLGSEMDSHYRSYEGYEREAEYIYNAGHWESYTTTDENGVVTTHEYYDYDVDSYNRAKENANSEFDKYSKIKEEYDRVKEVYLRIQEELERLYNFKKIVSDIKEDIDENMYCVDKYHNSMEKEMDYNIEALTRTIGILNEYKDIKKYYYDNRVTLHSMFPEALLGVTQTYKNIFYDRTRTDKISVSLEELSYSLDYYLTLNNKVNDCIRNFEGYANDSRSHIDTNFNKLLVGFIKEIKDFENEVENVRNDIMLTTDLKKSKLMLYQNQRYIKSKIIE